MNIRIWSVLVVSIDTVFNLVKILVELGESCLSTNNVIFLLKLNKRTDHLDQWWNSSWCQNIWNECHTNCLWVGWKSVLNEVGININYFLFVIFIIEAVNIEFFFELTQSRKWFSQTWSSEGEITKWLSLTEVQGWVIAWYLPNNLW